MGRTKGIVWEEFSILEDPENSKDGSNLVICKHCHARVNKVVKLMKLHLLECKRFLESCTNKSRILDVTRKNTYTTNYFFDYPIETGRDLEYRVGIIGGRNGSFMARNHVAGLEASKLGRIVCGCFSTDPGLKATSAVEYGISPRRSYSSYVDMLYHEQKLPDGMQVVCICSPNNTHFEIAKTALEYGYHVMCESPLCLIEEEAATLYRLVKKKERVFYISYPYCYYAMIRVMKDLLAASVLGELTTIRISFLQNHGVEEKRNPTWRSSPYEIGVSYCMGELGLTVYQVLRYLTAIPVYRIMACLAQSTSEQLLDDNCYVTMELEGGCSVFVVLSKQSVLHDNQLCVAIDGSEGSMEWTSDDADRLILQTRRDGKVVLTPSSGLFRDVCVKDYYRSMQFPQSGFIQAMTTMYGRFFHDISEHVLAEEEPCYSIRIDRAVESILFLSRCIESSQRNSTWVEMGLFDMERYVRRWFSGA